MEIGVLETKTKICKTEMKDNEYEALTPQFLTMNMWENEFELEFELHSSTNCNFSSVIQLIEFKIWLQTVV